MTLKERIDQDLKTAMREKDVVRLSVVRLLKSAIKYREIELAKALDDGEIEGVIASEVKRRRDSVEQYRAGNRQDLVDREEAEIRILQGWLPAPLSPDELAAKVDEVVRRLKASGPKDMGAVMKALLPEVQGRAEGKTVSELVKSRLLGR
ncbi:MAG TPA: GatB/YqeY domain-containing protein [Anaeromyxobacter sp.]|nr:GatB/YqeY domain-containing protein [Anaeromyxobacter sp.]